MKNQSLTVEVPATTLNAIKSLLFSAKEGGVDLTPIVNDLTVGSVNSDLVAVNVGLTFKGIKPEIDKTTRYEISYKDLVEYTFVAYSMIRDMVTYEYKTIAKWDSTKNDLCPYSDAESCLGSCLLSTWYDKPTDRSIPTAELVERWKKAETQSPAF